MTALVARIQRTAPLLLALLVPLAFMACDAEDPVAPTDLVSSTADAKGGNGKGGGPGGGGDGGGGTSYPGVEAQRFSPEIEAELESGSSFGIYAATADFATGYVNRSGVGEGFVISLPDGPIEYIETDESNVQAVDPMGIAPNGRVVGSIYYEGGPTKPFVREVGGQVRVFDPPAGYHSAGPLFRRPITSDAARILVDVRGATDRRLGILEPDAPGGPAWTLAGGEGYAFISPYGLSDDGYVVAIVQEFGSREYRSMSWSGVEGEALVELPGTGGRRGAEVRGVFDNPALGIFGVRDDRVVTWSGPSATPQLFADVPIEAVKSTAVDGRILGHPPRKGNDPIRLYCVNSSGAVSDLLPPAGFETLSSKGGSLERVVGLVRDVSTGERIPVLWDLTSAEGGC